MAEYSWNSKDSPQSELGGRTPESMSLDNAKALRAQNLGKPAWQRSVDRAAERQTEADAAQRVINSAGANAVRQAAIDADRRNGVDVDSEEYQQKLRLADIARSKR